MAASEEKSLLLHSRLSALERALLLQPYLPSSGHEASSISNRLENLSARTTYTTLATSEARAILSECSDLEAEACAVTRLETLYTSTSNSYSRNIVLASAEDLDASFRQLQIIQSQLSDNGIPSNSAILDNPKYHLCATSTYQSRLNKVCDQVEELNSRANIASDRLDDILGYYSDVMQTANEKIILFNEVLKILEKNGKNI
mmetsp:Transcript_9269/g.20489  ORF Transcript_9269/g.20489 Transcript_9269/m.20489 type:complete len:202 (-) Transcript_9269:283-888(-)